MITVRRLQAAAAFSAIVMAATCWQVGSKATSRRQNSPLGGVKPQAELSINESAGMFAGRPVITYQSGQSDPYFALQLKPQLPETASKPSDLIAVVDISASQAGQALSSARLLLEEIVKHAGADDRISIWVVNTPNETRELTRGLRKANDAQVKDALTQLEKVIYAAGATDLKAGLKKVLTGVSSQSDRRTAVVYMGDGDSVLDPLTDTDRAKFAADLVERKVPFFSVPLGTKLNAKTLHGLSHATGGSVIRMFGSDKPSDSYARIASAVNAPVFYPTKVEYSTNVGEVLPGRLPPLRSDTPILVAGLLKASPKLECKLEGEVDGRTQTLTIKEDVPVSDKNNFFLINVVKQWRGADHNAPAIMRADRGLASAFEQSRLAREEFVNQAVWAVGMNKLDAAQNLFEAARNIDPTDTESAAGVAVVRRLKAGETDMAKIVKESKAVEADMAKLVKATTGLQVTEDEPVIIAPTQPPVTPTQDPGTSNLLDLEKRRRAVQEQQLTSLVDDAIRQARKLVNTDPDAAYDLLKRQLASIRDNGDLSETVRAALIGRLEGSLRTVHDEGARVKQRQETDLRVRIAAEARRSAEVARASEEEKIRERVRIFGSLMDRARYEEALREAQVLAQDLISKGRVPPPAVNAGIQMNTLATNIRNYDEVRKVKEDRIILVMMQVESSHIPFADEPPVAFPPATVWKEMSDYRRDRYSVESLGGFSRRTIELRDKLAKPVSDLPTFEGFPLREVLKSLGDNFEITFIVNLPAFKEAGMERVEEQPIRLQKMPGVSLGTILNFMLSQVNGTYVIKKDYVEITTRRAAAFDKIVKAFPVADLVIPIPSAVDPLALQQNLQVLGGSLSAAGQAIFGAAGGGLNLGNFGGAQGIGAIGIGGIGGFGALGVGGGAGGGGGQSFLGGAQGFQGGALGFAGGTQNVNLGFGGGVTGFGGGQQGQFGNLGGQFGLQGGDTSFMLIELIQNLIAPKEWNTRASQMLAGATLSTIDEELPPTPLEFLNALQYYQPSRALVVRGSSKVHTKVGDFVGAAGAPGGAKAAVDDGTMLVFGPGAKDKSGGAVAKAPKKPEPQPVVAAAPKAPHDPKTTWQESMDQGKFKPRNVIAVADFLTICDKHEDAAELLKANIRHGLLIHPSVFDALAVALESSKATIEEIERAQLSKIDLDPENPKNFLDVAQAMVDLDHAERAVEFCKRAASLDPNSSDAYRRVLTIKTDVRNPAMVEAVKWAANSLLEREWEIDGALNHQHAKTALEQLAGQLQTLGRTDEATALRNAAARSRQRDLVVELTWNDAADLDLVVAEPVGTVCSVKQPRTPAGGLWSGDRFGSRLETYAAAQAFNGAYELTVRKVWGEPMGGKATVKVTYHQGTPQESTELHTMVLDSHGQAKLKIEMADGRRTTSESVPVTAMVKRLPITRESPDDVYTALRAMTDPMLVTARPGMRMGSSAGGSLPEQARSTTGYEPGVELSHQTKVSPALSSGIDLLTQTTISPDRSTMRVSLSPNFNAASVQPQVPLAAVPGGR